MWNLFSKKKPLQTVNNDGQKNDIQKKSDDTAEKKISKKDKSLQPEMPKMNMLQRMAMKRIEKMSPAEREKMMKKALSPKNVQKHKTEILQMIEQMKTMGASDDQIRLMKKKLGL